MIDLEDFSYFQEAEEKLKNNQSDNIEILKEEFQKKLKEEREKAFQEGYKKGITEGKNEIEKQLKEQFQKIVQEKEIEFNKKYSEVEQLKSQLKVFQEEIKKKYEDYLDHINNILLDSLSEILEFLYIDSINESFISRTIQGILEEFKEQTKAEITVNPEFVKHLKSVFPNAEIKSDEKMEKGDFVIVFPELQVENKIKDKIEILKDEIKREIKKFT
jgi:flagellar biosynthesis/type III secretory pathway protein FliH